MCGIVGVYNLNGAPVPSPILKQMTDSIRHRGPDSDGYYFQGPVGLGHRRLAIIDLSPAGKQPMGNVTGDIVITYNGELYNYQELAIELQAMGYRFQSKTDTEVIVYAYEAWGSRCVERFNGMFAFAIYDRRDHLTNGGGKLFLGRDRYGIKPLYYYHSQGVFLFASEVKAFLKHPDFSVRVSPSALGQYFTFQNVFTDETLFEGVHLLPAGHVMTVDAAESPAVKTSRYWDYCFQDDSFNLSLEDTTDELYRLFEQAVVRQLMSDVPVGAYLSGGMDSGSITAIAARSIPRIHTFTGGFDLSSASGLERGFDERTASEEMANIFKTEHYEIVMHAGDMEHILPDLVWHLEDLRVGQSYPNYYISGLASKFVKVVLSGAGGDELFAGYPWRYYRGADAVDAQDYYRLYYRYWQRLVPDESHPRLFNEGFYSEIKHTPPFECFRSIFANGNPHLDNVEQRINASLYFEAKTFLHGLFVVEDKLSMAHSLETRVPFLDNDLVDFAMRIPPHLKLRELRYTPQVDEDDQGKTRLYQTQPSADGKLVLRRAMSRIIPDSTNNRVKQGFSAPDASWFRGESINYINNLMRQPHARIFEYLKPNFVYTMLDEHTSGKVNHRLLIWSLLSFEWWLRRFMI